MLNPIRSETIRRHDDLTASVLLHIEEHLEDPLPLRELAALVGLSPHHFHRVFHRVTGETPKDHLRRLRLERAVYRMKISPDNILQIAIDAGFATNETFTRAFIRQFELSPSEFRSILKSFRAAVGEMQASHTFEGFTDDTPLILRFDMQRSPVKVERTPGRHLLFVRHRGYEGLLAREQPLVDLWSDLVAWADENGIPYASDTLIAITHDDPYVTEDSRVRFDACIEIPQPVAAPRPFMYRRLPPQLCVTRRHGGGLEEIAQTFAHIGIEWAATRPYALATASPFVVYRCSRGSGGERAIEYADAHVPLNRYEGTS